MMMTTTAAAATSISFDQCLSIHTTVSYNIRFILSQLKVPLNKTHPFSIDVSKGNVVTVHTMTAHGVVEV
jgi:hypothetical protein